MKESIYDTITRQIAEAIDEGAALYRMPWHSPRADIANPANVGLSQRHMGQLSTMEGTRRPGAAAAADRRR